MMAIRGDSYSSVAGIVALVRPILEAASASNFNSTTRPTLTEVESFIDEASGLLNIAARKHGFAPAALAANSTAKLACDNWVRGKAVNFVQLTAPNYGIGGMENDETDFYDGLLGSADAFMEMNCLGFKREGVTVADPTHQGLKFTAEDDQDDRTDPDDSSLEQPKFTRGMLDYD